MCSLRVNFDGIYLPELDYGGVSGI
jgi:hypothetical protein